MKEKVVEKLAGLITAGFGLVAALAWNDTIKAIFQKVFSSPDKLLPMIIYAFIVTIVAVIATTWIGGIAEKLNKLKKIELKESISKISKRSNNTSFKKKD